MSRACACVCCKLPCSLQTSVIVCKLCVLLKSDSIKDEVFVSRQTYFVFNFVPY